jgi:hypothetical protein
MWKKCNCVVYAHFLLMFFIAPVHAFEAQSPPHFARTFQNLVPEQRGNTHFIALQYGSSLSRQVSQLRSQGYELSSGEAVNFDGWYSTSWQDLQLAWMTQVSPRLGLIWGMGTGERGEKYGIDPSLQLGFVFHQPIGKQSTFTFRASTRVGGRLREKTCMATYTLLGYDKPQPVNCRLAATELAPEDTLQFLFNDSPSDRMQLNVGYTWSFY